MLKRLYCDSFLSQILKVPDVHQSFLSGLLVTFQRDAVSSHPASPVQTHDKSNAGAEGPIQDLCSDNTHTVLKHVLHCACVGLVPSLHLTKSFPSYRLISPKIRQPFPLSLEACLQKLFPVVSFLTANTLLRVPTPSSELCFFFF